MKIKIPTIFFTIILFSFFGLAQSSEAATYYVSPTGNDSNSGTITAPFKTIQKAADIVNPGDTVIVKDGVYIDTDGNRYIVWLQRSGTPDQYITFRSENKWGAKIVGDGNVSSMDYGFMAGFDSSAAYIRIEDFDMYDMNEAIVMRPPTHDFYFYRNKIHDLARGQIACDTEIYGGNVMSSGTSNITFDSNVLYNIGRLPGGCPTLCKDYRYDHAIYSLADNFTAINNIFYDNEAGWHLHVAGDNMKIVNNTFYGGNPCYTGQIILLDSVPNGSIENNISYNSRNAFIREYLFSCPANINIKNNLIYGSSNILLEESITGCYPAKYSLQNNIIGQDPLFVDLASRDFHLQAGSPAIDAGLGASSYMTRDMDGNARPQGLGWDIGAYEYVFSQTDIIPPSPPMGLSVN